MQNMIFDSVFKVDFILENKSDFLKVADSILNRMIWKIRIDRVRLVLQGKDYFPVHKFWLFFMQVAFRGLGLTQQSSKIK